MLEMLRKRICFVVAVPGTADAFMRDHINVLRQDYDVYLAGNIVDAAQVSRLNINGWQHVDILRPISLINDLKTVFQLYRYLKKMQFDAVHSITPKAGLVCSLAAWLAGVKHRTHIYTGQVWATRRGVMRWLLMLCDKITALFDNHILVDGEPQRQFLIKNRIISDKNSLVLGSGSISGVNTLRFTPCEDVRKEVRLELGVSDEHVVFCFMGRQNSEKGIYELYTAFNKLAAEMPNVILLMFGSDEENCMSHLPEYANVKPGENFIFYGKTSTPEKHLQGADVFCMPSYREGFGTSVIEASCLGIPVICSDIYGLQDAMVDGVTGLQCKVADVDSLYDSMKFFVENREVGKEYGANGRTRVLTYFAGEVISQHWYQWYHSLLSK